MILLISLKIWISLKILTIWFLLLFLKTATFPTPASELQLNWKNNLNKKWGNFDNKLKQDSSGRTKGKIIYLLTNADLQRENKPKIDLDQLCKMKRKGPPWYLVHIIHLTWTSVSMVIGRSSSFLERLVQCTVHSWRSRLATKSTGYYSHY